MKKWLIKTGAFLMAAVFVLSAPILPSGIQQVEASGFFAFPGLYLTHSDDCSCGIKSSMTVRNIYLTGRTHRFELVWSDPDVKPGSYETTWGFYGYAKDCVSVESSTNDYILLKCKGESSSLDQYGQIGIRATVKAVKAGESEASYGYPQFDFYLKNSFYIPAPGQLITMKKGASKKLPVKSLKVDSSNPTGKKVTVSSKGVSWKSFSSKGLTLNSNTGAVKIKTPGYYEVYANGNNSDLPGEIKCKYTIICPNGTLKLKKTYSVKKGSSIAYTFKPAKTKKYKVTYLEWDTNARCSLKSNVVIYDSKGTEIKYLKGLGMDRNGKYTYVYKLKAGTRYYVCMKVGSDSNSSADSATLVVK